MPLEIMVNRAEHPADSPPRAIIHKKILDVAEDDPRASVDAIANQVGGATRELVTKVIDEYGDPSANSEELSGDGGYGDTVEQQAAPDDVRVADSESIDQSNEDRSAPTDESETQPSDADVDRSTLSANQIETLRLIHRNPEATQQEIADELDVVRATVSNRVNDIDEFDWQRRLSFVQDLFADQAEHSEESPVATATETADTHSDGSSKDREIAAKPVNVSDGSMDNETGKGEGGQKSTGRKNVSDSVTAERDTEPPVERLGSLEDRLTGLESAVAALETAAGVIQPEPSTDGNEVVEVGEQREADEQSEVGKQPEATADTCVENPELVHKAIQAIFEDDEISESEEMKLLQLLL